MRAGLWLLNVVASMFIVGASAPTAALAAQPYKVVKSAAVEALAALIMSLPTPMAASCTSRAATASTPMTWTRSNPSARFRRPTESMAPRSIH